jgi:hypothetical protein
MAESIISPGVYTRENDVSFITPAPIQAGAAFVGPTVKGPKNQPLIVTSYSDYVRKFGETFLSASNKQYEFLTSVAVKNYFQNGGSTALITRVVSGTYSPAQSTIISSGLTTVAPGFASGSFTVLNSSTASWNQIKIEASTALGNIAYTIFNTPYIATGSFQNSGDFLYVGVGDGDQSFNGNNVAPSTTAWAGYVVNAINNGSSNISSRFSASFSGGSLIIRSDFAGAVYNSYKLTSSFGVGTPVRTTFTGGSDGSSTNPFVIKTLGEGVIYNNATGSGDPGLSNSDGSLVSGSADNVRWEISNINTALGTFTLTVRGGLDSTNNKTVLETFNVNLDPNSDNYIEKVVGNQYMTVSTDTDSGVAYNTLVGNYPNASNYIRVDSVTVTTPNYLATNGVTVNRDANGNSYSASLPIPCSGSFFGALGAVKPAATFFGDITNTSTDAQGVVAANYDVALSLLANKDEYQFNIISAPGLVYKNSNFTSTINSFIALAENRGDCIAVVDLVGLNEPSISGVINQAASLNSSYAATYWPWLQIKSATGRNEWAPAGTVIPGVYAFTDASAAPWFAPAGLVRGGIGGVIQAERKLTKGNRDDLYSAKVNPIATFPGSGIAVFGQKTLQSKASALDRVNVRRLLIELKKFIGDQARNLVFEQNTDATRTRFLSIVTPYLESVVQRQGLFAFRVVMDDTNNTADVIDRNQLVGQIFIQPAKTAEFVVLDFTIEPTGATFA